MSRFIAKRAFEENIKKDQTYISLYDKKLEKKVLKKVSCSFSLVRWWETEKLSSSFNFLTTYTNFQFEIFSNHYISKCSGEKFVFNLVKIILYFNEVFFLRFFLNFLVSPSKLFIIDFFYHFNFFGDNKSSLPHPQSLLPW